MIKLSFHPSFCYTFQKYGNPNLKLLLPLWLQLTQDKNKGSYELGLLVLLKIINQNMRSLYSKDDFLYKLSIRTILIRVMFNTYCILIFDLRGMNMDLKRNKVILTWPATKTMRSFFHNKSIYPHNQDDVSDFRSNLSQDS